MRKRNYVVGFSGANQCVYGKNNEKKRDWLDLLTRKEADKMVKTLYKDDEEGVYNKRTIYQLTPIKIID